MSLLNCPHCGKPVENFPFPLLTVDCIIRDSEDRVLLVKRRFPPPGWALPGGFVDKGETVEQAVIREVEEETSLSLRDVKQFRVYSEPSRDQRHHVVSVVFTGESGDRPSAGDDAAEARFFSLNALPEPLAFDHAEILNDYATAHGDP